MEWMDIKNGMPPNNEVVFVTGITASSRVVFKARYIAEHTVKCSDFGMDTECGGEYDDEDDEFYVPQGWYERIENWEDFTDTKVVNYEITDWKPLPRPAFYRHEHDCRCREIEEKNPIADERGFLEYDAHCKKCGNFLYHFAYGTEDWS